MAEVESRSGRRHGRYPRIGGDHAAGERLCPSTEAAGRNIQRSRLGDGDGAKDTRRVYSTIEARPSRSPTKILIPPRSNARSPLRSGQLQSRDHTMQLVGKLGIRRWRKSSGYMRRRLVETTISRFKVIVGRRLRSRTMASQRTESKIACRILNTMTELGMPDSYCGAWESHQSANHVLLCRGATKPHTNRLDRPILFFLSTSR